MPSSFVRLPCVSLEGSVVGVGGQCSQVKAFVPVWVQSSLADRSCLGLLAVDGRDSEGVGKTWMGVNKAVDLSVGMVQRTEDISLIEAIGSND